MHFFFRFFFSELKFFVEASLGNTRSNWLSRRSARAEMPPSTILRAPPTRTRAIVPGLRALLPKSIPSTVLVLSNRCRNVPNFDLLVRYRRSRMLNNRPATLLRGSHLLIIHRSGPRHRLRLRVLYAQARDLGMSRNVRNVRFGVSSGGDEADNRDERGDMEDFHTARLPPHPSKTPKTHLLCHPYSRAIQDALNVPEGYL